jgi:hypothetical protein
VSAERDSLVLRRKRVPKTRKLLYDRYTNGHVPGYLLVRVSKTGAESVAVGSSISYGDNFWNT